MNRFVILWFFTAFTGVLVSAEIHDAAERGDMATVRKLVGQDRKVIQQKDKAGNLPLHLAALKADVEIMQALLKAGAGVNAKGFDDMTPLHYAAKANSEQACRLLLENGADRSALNALSQTPAKLAKAWVAHVIQTFVPKVSGDVELFQAVEAADLPKVKALITAKPELLAAGDDLGLTALLLAAKRDNLPLMKLLLEAGADVNATDRNGNSALDRALDAGSPDAVRLLLQFKIKLPREGGDNDPLMRCLLCVGCDGLKKIISKLPDALDAVKNQVRHLAVEISSVGQPAGALPALTGDVPLPSQGARLKTNDNAGTKPWFAAFGNAVDPLTFSVPPAQRGRYLEMARLLIESGVKVNYTFATNSSPLMCAAMADTPDALRLLLKSGATLEMPGTHGPQALDYAIMAEQLENVRVLLAAGADPLFRDTTLNYRGGIALACKQGQYQMVETLLAGVKDRSRLAAAVGPLLSAVEGGHLAIVRLLLDAGLPVNGSEMHGITPLHRAVTHESAEITELLLHAGADVNAQDKAGYAPLHNAAEANKPQHIPVLLQHGAKLEAMTVENYTPAMLSAEWDGAVLSLLLKAGARIDGVATTGFSALHSAASIGSSEAIKILLKAGLPVDSRSRGTNRTALALAASAGTTRRQGFENKPMELNGMALTKPRYGTAADYLAVVETLLAAGADVAAVDKEGFTPLHHAVMGDQLPIARLLLEKGAKVDAVSQKQFTPLHIAAGGSSPMIELLLGRGADVNAVQKNQPSKYTPLMWAVDVGKVDNLKLLIQRGADLKCRAFDKKASALHMAAMHGHVDIAEVLVSAGLPVDSKDADELTPLMVAVQAGYKDMCEWLIRHGADVNARARNGIVPWAIAAQIRNEAIAALLRQHGAR